MGVPVAVGVSYGCLGLPLMLYITLLVGVVTLSRSMYCIPLPSHLSENNELAVVNLV